MEVSRREVLRLLGAAGVTAAGAELAAACGGGGSGDVGGHGAGSGSPASSAGAATLRFPAGFGWGAATSAYQIEGAATADGRGESIWDRFCAGSGHIVDGSSGAVAADHYHRYRADLDLMRDLGLRSYRFSISWPRIQPTGSGRPNQRGLDFYRRLVDGLSSRSIRPMATLFHWDLPQALQDRGGWENRATADRFADYASIVFAALGADVPVWLTLNEPKTVVNVGYLSGQHAPGKQDESAAYVALHHMLLAHGKAVQAFRAAATGQRIGPALNLTPVYPAAGSASGDSASGDSASGNSATGNSATGNAAAVTQADGLENRLYLDPIFHGRYPPDMLDYISSRSPMADRIRDSDLATIGSAIDILGVQYYTPAYVTETGEYVNLRPRSEATWQQIYPQGLYDLLVRLAKDYGTVPVTITENGVPTPDEPGPDGTVADAQRVTFLHDHLVAAHRALAAGVRLESFHVWSLMDNFEWAEGYTQRWGMVFVDFDSQKRIPKQSARWYRDVIRANALR